MQDTKMQGTKDIDSLIDLMARLPGLGPRSARRAVLQMIRKRTLLLEPLARQIARVSETARECLTCGNIGTADTCDICADDRRQNGQICVVEDVADLWAMERARAFKGRYHVLGGTLSALDQVGPDQLRIPRLLTRVVDDGVTEVILALPATIDGQTTAHYIVSQLRGPGLHGLGRNLGSNSVRLTSLGQGVPVGGELDFLDEGTILAALAGRKDL